MWSLVLIKFTLQAIICHYELAALATSVTKVERTQRAEVLEETLITRLSSKS